MPSAPDHDFVPRLDRQDPYLRLQSVTVFVRDLDKSLAFYVDVLGFQLAFDARTVSDRPWAVVSPPDGHCNLTLVAPAPESPEYKLIGRVTHVSFITEDLLAKFREWSARGVKFLVNPRLRRLKPGVKVLPRRSPPLPEDHIQPTSIWGAVYSRFLDIDGNSFSLVSFDEVTQAIDAQRRAISEHLEAERRAAQELEIAKQVQSRLFPQTLPRLRTLDYAGACHQARQVGGDYYDFLSLGDNRLALVVGDISGKGIAAALLMANLQANLRSQCAVSQGNLQRLLCSVNQLFCENTPNGSFATLFFAEYDDNSRRLRYANCGHLSALVLHADASLQRLSSTATILGAFPEWDCEIGECQLQPGDTFALYTDGVTESFNPHNEEFGEDRLIAALRRNQSLSPCDLITAIVHEVRLHSPHEQHDDITLIAAKSI